jgi:GntR family transcriptional regulator, arabinose operon transcriptional repressor
MQGSKDMAEDEKEYQKKPFLYETVKNDILAMVHARGMKAHDPLPSEGTIAEIYNVSRMTGKLALKALEDEGIVYRVNRRGSFLAEGFEEKTRGNTAVARTGHERQARQLSIALVVPGFDFYVGDIIRSVQSAAEANSVRVFLHMTDDDPHEEDRVLAELSRLTYIHGIILFPTSRPDVSKELLTMKLARYPLVLIDRTFDNLAFDSVVHGHYQGAHDMTSYLIERGHRNVGFVSEPLSTSRSREQRYQGYLHALMEHNAPVKKDHIQIISADIHTAHGYHVLDSPALPALRGYLEANKQLTAVVCAEDYVALEVYYAAVGLGLRVPEDLSVSGFTDNRVLRFAPVRLSTVRQPVDAMGEKAIDLLIRRVSEPGRESVEIVIDTEIVDRESIANLT